MHAAALALLLATGPVPAPACATPAHRAFDFWAGDWDGYDVGAEDTKAARVTVERALDGCALYEVYEGTNGLVGRSLSVYDAARGAWHQTWVTNRGQLLMVDGRMDGDAIVFEGTNPGADGRRSTASFHTVRGTMTSPKSAARMWRRPTRDS